MIKLTRNHQGWHATFKGVGDMPEGVAIPLPYTAQAGVFIVVSDMQDRFPQARIFAS